MRITEWLFFAMLLCFSWYMGMMYERSNAKFCVERPKVQQQYPKTKAEMKKFIEAHMNQGKGWKK